MSDTPRPDIETVFEHYGKRILSRGNGAWSKCECPLLSHEDRNPSASVNLETGKWNCFSCDSHGDVYDIVERNEQLAGFAESRKFCEETFGPGSREVRNPRMGRSGLSSVTRNHRGGSTFVPPWRL